MLVTPSTDAYSADEIARAAGVSAEAVVAAIGDANALVPFAAAVQIGRVLARRASGVGPPARALFSVFLPTVASQPTTPVPLVVSGMLHLVVLAVFIAGLGLTPRAAALRIDARSPGESMRLVFVALPGPGGGGGGGGLQQRAPAPKALREGRNKMSSPLPSRRPPKAIVPVPMPPEPKPAPLSAEPLPAVVAPIIAVPSDARDRRGVLEQTAETVSHGSGRGGSVGTGTGTGVGEGEGPGIGPGSGGGIGGGPYRPGSGITAPRLIREVKPDYTEEARLHGLEGDVVLEIVVRRDGLVGDVKLLQGLASGLNERAVQAVRQWRFAPAERLGSAIDVVVEVAVEFKLR